MSSKWVQLKWTGSGGVRNLVTKLTGKDKEWLGSQMKTDMGNAAQRQVREQWGESEGAVGVAVGRWGGGCLALKSGASWSVNGPHSTGWQMRHCSQKTGWIQLRQRDGQNLPRRGQGCRGWSLFFHFAMHCGAWVCQRWTNGGLDHSASDWYRGSVFSCFYSPNPEYCKTPGIIF